jgi:hypothetical protein
MLGLMRFEKLLQELTELHIMGGRKDPEAAPEIRRDAKTQYDSVVGSRRGLFHAAFSFRDRKIVYDGTAMVKGQFRLPKNFRGKSTA